MLDEQAGRRGRRAGRGSASRESMARADAARLLRLALGQPDLGPDDDFMAAGGDSLRALIAVRMLTQRVRRPRPLRPGPDRAPHGRRPGRADRHQGAERPPPRTAEAEQMDRDAGPPRRTQLQPAAGRRPAGRAADGAAHRRDRLRRQPPGPRPAGRHRPAGVLPGPGGGRRRGRRAGSGAWPNAACGSRGSPAGSRESPATSASPASGWTPPPGSTWPRTATWCCTTAPWSTCCSATPRTVRPTSRAPPRCSRLAMTHRPAPVHYVSTLSALQGEASGGDRPPAGAADSVDRRHPPRARLQPVQVGGRALPGGGPPPRRDRHRAAARRDPAERAAPASQHPGADPPAAVGHPPARRRARCPRSGPTTPPSTTPSARVVAAVLDRAAWGRTLHVFHPDSVDFAEALPSGGRARHPESSCAEFLARLPATAAADRRHATLAAPRRAAPRAGRAGRGQPCGANWPDCSPTTRPCTARTSAGDWNSAGGWPTRTCAGPIAAYRAYLAADRSGRHRCSPPRCRRTQPAAARRRKAVTCATARWEGSAGRSARSATACGASPAARAVSPAPTTTPHPAAWTWRSSSAATSSTPRGPTDGASASRCSAHCCAATPARKLYVATKIPPKNMDWPPRRRRRAWTRCSRPRISGSTPTRAWRTSAPTGSTCCSSTSGRTGGLRTSGGRRRCATSSGRA